MRRSSSRRRDNGHDASIAEARIWNATTGGDQPPGPPVPIPPFPYGEIPQGEPPPVIPPPPGTPRPEEAPESDGFIPFSDAISAAPPPPSPAAPPSAAPGSAPPSADRQSPEAPPGGDPPPARWSIGATERRGPMARLRALVTGDELDPGRPGLRVLITVAVVAALVAVAFWWRSRPHAEPLPAPAPVAPAASRQAPMGSPGALGSPPAPGLTPPVPASASPSATAVVVDVAGKVRHPGVVRLPPGSRVVDAIRAAGGVRSGAHTDTLNLARVVVDGEQIVVGAASAAGQTPPPGVPPAGATPGATPGTPVSLNNGTAEQFDTLPGVGPVLAKRIIDYRTQHGGFHSVDELGDVQGIGPKRMADLKPLVTP